MFIKIKEKEFELNTKLGTTFKIEEKFKKPYVKMLQNIDNMTAKEQIEMLCCGISKDEEKDFKNAIYENGFGDLTDILEDFVESLQYPGLTKEEIEEKKLAKLAKQNHYKEIGLIN